jgi:acylphosphatase
VSAAGFAIAATAPVEAVVQGDDEFVERLVDWCRRGPAGASVAAVAVDPHAVDAALNGFSARPTA